MIDHKEQPSLKFESKHKFFIQGYAAKMCGLPNILRFAQS